MEERQLEEKDVARRLRARGLTAGLEPGEIARSIHENCYSTHATSRLKAQRLARGVSLDDIVEQVRARFEAEGRKPRGLTTSLLSCYESGRKIPGMEYLHYLCQVYGTSPAELGFDRPCVCGGEHRYGQSGTERPAAASADSAPRRRDSALAGTGVAADAGAADTAAVTGGTTRVADRGVDETDDDTLRRTMLQALGGGGVALDGPLLGAVDRLRRRMDDTLVSATVSPTMLDEWEEATTGYGRRYMSVPPLWLLLEAMLDFSDVRRHAQRRQAIELQERLCRVTAQLGGLVGILMIDLGDRRMAQSFFRTARVAADETGDRALRAWVVVREAVVPLYYGDPAKAVELARRSQGLAGGTRCAASAMAPALEARARARLGHRDTTRDARQALQRAESALSRLPADEQADTAFGYTEHQLRFHQGNVLTHLGAAADAVRTQDEALRLYPESVTLDRTLIGFDRASCHLQRGEVERALELGRDLVDTMPSGHRTDIVLNRARDLCGEVPRSCSGLAVLREFREALATGATTGVTHVSEDTNPR